MGGAAACALAVALALFCVFRYWTCRELVILLAARFAPDALAAPPGQEVVDADVIGEAATREPKHEPKHEPTYEPTNEENPDMA